MKTDLFPDFPGLGWDVKVTDEFSNIIQKAATPGFDTRLSLGPDPLVHLELTYNYLREYARTGAATDYQFTMSNEIRKLRGFFRAMQGDYYSFLVKMSNFTRNAADSTIVGQVLTKDANGVAPMVVSDAYYTERIYEVAGVNGNPGTAPVLKAMSADSTPVPITLTPTTDYTWAGPGYSSAGITYPGVVAVITREITGTLTADFTWYYRMRFEQSTQKFDKFLALLWRAQQVQLVTSRT